MRVIAGKAGGIPLLVPKTDLRPTMDMVRAAIFSSLSDTVVGARVLDLFAGTGSMGIEALSRGAASACFVESNRKACAILEANLQRTRLEGIVFSSDVFRFLERNRDTGPHELILADPPYCKKKGADDLAARLVLHPNLPSMLAAGGVFILEVAEGWQHPEGALWKCLRRKRYGSTETLFLEPWRMHLLPDTAGAPASASVP